MLKKLFLTSFFMLISASFSFAKIIHVPEDQPTIQDGIKKAKDGDIVLVADGTYTGDGNKDLSFKGMAITVKSENGPGSTIIDCEGNGRGFMFNKSEGSDSVLDGFTITNGRLRDDGAGIRIYACSPIIKNCIITGNKTEGTGAGGGIDIMFASDIVVLQNLQIIENTTLTNGGGIRVIESVVQIQDGEITSNHAEVSGGGLYIGDGSTVTGYSWVHDNTPDDIAGPGNFGDFTLPVELSSFSAISTREGVKIAWETVSETNCLGFNILRNGQKLNGQIIKAKGPSEYIFWDKDNNSGFYELEEISLSGEITRFKPVLSKLATTWGKIKKQS